MIRSITYYHYLIVTYTSGTKRRVHALSPQAESHVLATSLFGSSVTRIEFVEYAP